MDWLQAITIITSMVATMVGGIMYIHSDIKDIRREMHQQNARIDKLYEMFVDLLKSKNI